MLVENTENYISFAFPIEKGVTRIDKNGRDIMKIISYHILYQLIDSTNFMANLLSNLSSNLAAGIQKIKWKYKHGDQKCKTCRIKYKVWDCFLEYTNFKDDLIEYKCLCCNKSYQKKVS